MSRKKLIAGAATLAVLAGGASAVAATTSTDRKAEEQAFLADAAKRLGVSSEQLTSALTAAQDARLAAAVKAGDAHAGAGGCHQGAPRRRRHGALTRPRAGRPGRRGHGGRGGGRELLADAAKAIGITEDALKTQLRDGKTLTAIVKAEGKTLADVQAAVKKAAVARLDADLKAKTITQAQYDEAVEHLNEHISRLGDAKFGPGGKGGPRGERPSGTATPTPHPLGPSPSPARGRANLKRDRPSLGSPVPLTDRYGLHPSYTGRAPDREPSRGGGRPRGVRRAARAGRGARPGRGGADLRARDDPWASAAGR